MADDVDVHHGPVAAHAAGPPVIDGGRMDRLVDRLPQRLQDVGRRIVDRDVLLVGSSLAFYGLISAMPLLLLTFAAVRAIGGQELVDAAIQTVGRMQQADQVSAILEQLASSSRQLSWVTFVLVLWPASAYGGGLRRALQRASGQEEPFSGLRGRLRGVGLVLALPFSLLAGIPLAFVLTGLSGDGILASLLGWVLALVAATLAGSALNLALYKTFAPRDLGWRAMAAGAALTAVTTALFSVGFAIYLGVGSIEQRFGGGAIGAIVLFGIWLFVANVLLVAGYLAVLELQGAISTEQRPTQR